MNWLPDIFRRRKIYGDLAEEMRLHLEERTEQLMSEGMSRKEAERVARRAFGSIDGARQFLPARRAASVNPVEALRAE